MLKLKNISKTYTGGEAVVALTNVELEFRQSEFVAILGPSGCGKTTMLNIIGGLDRYDSGDLVIKGVSTKAFKDADWDAYRNRSIGFVFQNYNLIGHQTVLQNVELAMTLSGVGASERRKRAKAVLEEVGLTDKLYKRPNQLSGGQMQRVAIARALVNNPEIIMADEPTGALDSGTSTQIMDILKEIAKTRLVIIVTHNPEIADKYATRIIKLLDGEVQTDSNPPQPAESAAEKPLSKSYKMFKRTSMSLWTAASLSFKNLLTKKGRTITTAFAGSVGIISVALVLALSTGLTRYMDTMQSDVLASFPITIVTGESMLNITGWAGVRFEAFPEDNTIHRFNQMDFLEFHINILSDEFLEYVAEIPYVLPGAINTISYSRLIGMNVLSAAGDAVTQFNTMAGGGGPMAMLMSAGFPGMGPANPWQELPDNHDFVLSLYELIGEGSRMPQAKNELLLVVDEYNRLPESFFTNLGIPQEHQDFNFDDFLGQSFLTLIRHNDFFQPVGPAMFMPATPDMHHELFHGGVELTVVGILRIRQEAGGEFFSEGFVYTSALTAYVMQQAAESDIVRAALAAPGTNIFTGAPFLNENEERMVNLVIGADQTPVAINIFAVDFESKERVTEYLDAFNYDRPTAEHVVYTNLAELISAMTATLLSLMSTVLIGFASISLVVSTIMIGIVTSVSVVERTKEIGILRSVGARKKDISRVFSAEAVIIGFTAGAIGVGIAWLLTIPINLIVRSLIDGGAGVNVAILTPFNALVLIAGSMALTIIAGFLPSKTAARKDPVEALRTE
ncbi:MAG: ATP-binding cassette domain-containing protein [Defluviitaleaceae bacterium]|nr:ATP-binding cassette domain-containing protein [Defluviitaleaceae bacterium]